MSDLLKIYVVEDDPFLSDVMSLLLSPEGDVEVFETAEACLQRCQQHMPDLMFLDVDLPGMNGFELCRQIRADFSAPTELQIIFVSAKDRLESRMEGFDAGGDDYMVKPVEGDLLARKVQLARKAIQQQRRLAEQSAFAARTAMTAMSSSGEMGVILEFMRHSFTATTIDELGQRLLSAIGNWGLRTVLELRSRYQHPQHFSSSGSTSPLEASIFSRHAEQGRITDFKNRSLFHYQNVSILIHDMPVDDQERYGRFRDHLLMLAEAANARLLAIDAETTKHYQARTLSDAAQEIRQSLQLMINEETRILVDTSRLIDGLLHDVTDKLMGLGLRMEDEAYLLDHLHDASRQVREILLSKTSLEPTLSRLIQRFDDMATQ